MYNIICVPRYKVKYYLRNYNKTIKTPNNNFINYSICWHL